MSSRVIRHGWWFVFLCCVVWFCCRVVVLGIFVDKWFVVWIDLSLLSLSCSVSCVVILALPCVVAELSLVSWCLCLRCLECLHFFWKAILVAFSFYVCDGFSEWLRYAMRRRGGNTRSAVSRVLQFISLPSFTCPFLYLVRSWSCLYIFCLFLFLRRVFVFVIPSPSSFSLSLSLSSSLSLSFFLFLGSILTHFVVLVCYF